MRLWQVITTSILIFPGICQSSCPPSSFIAPCHCSDLDHSLFCKSILVKSLTQLLHPFIIHPRERYKSLDFTGDIDNRGLLRSLDKNDFRNITFEIIVIRLTSLITVHEDSFADNTRVTWKLSMPYNLLTEQVFAATSKFKKLQVLRLPYNRIQKIPANAFPANQLELHKIDLSFNQITAIGNSAFSQLANLNHINLNNNKIRTIGSYAFIPPHSVTNKAAMTVELEVNDLTSRSFRSDSLQKGRKVFLKLAVNRIEILSEIVFRNIFDSGGLIDMKRNPMLCDCRIPRYLLNQTRDSCLNCFCSNGTSIFELIPKDITCPISPTPSLPCLVISNGNTGDQMPPLPREERGTLKP